MTLLQQIQNDAIESDGDIGALLRRCRILAQRLGVAEFKEWVVCELEGYPSEEDLPKYRVIRTPLSFGYFVGAYGRVMKNGQIPIGAIPETLRDDLTTLRFAESVGSITDLIRQDRNDLHLHWPADYIAFVGQGNIYSGMHLLQAWRIINVSQMSDILSQIRNRVLSFALELESRNPEAGESLPSRSTVSVEQV